MDQKKVFDLLKDVLDPTTGKSLMRSKRIQGFHQTDHQIAFAIEIDGSEEKLFHAIQATCTDILKQHFQGQVLISLTAHRDQQTKPQTKVTKLSLPTIKAIIAVSSGKGGVGKSTVAFNLALAARILGYRVGLLDADIYGPSLPLLINYWQRPDIDDQRKMIPPEVFGLKVQSMGFVLAPQDPVIWRGPMAQSTFQQFLTDTLWGDLDLLFIDLPPGTGDIHLTMAQRVPLHGAVIVTTPQDLALLDGIKAIKMFETLNVPVLGLIENMSHLVCPACDHVIDLFGHGEVRKIAATQDLPFLGEIPLTIDLRIACDTGKPLALSKPDHGINLIFQKMTQDLIQSLGLQLKSGI